MLRLWRLFAPGMGAGYLPEAGGSMDQAAVMMDAFGVMSDAAAKLEKEYEARLQALQRR